MSQNQTHIKNYFVALSQMQTGAGLARFFHADVEQIEYPNRLVEAGAKRDLATLLEGAERGKAIMRRQVFALKKLMDDGENIAAEIEWRGELAVAVGALQPGDEMAAHFACFFEFKNGLIWQQRNYDCFEAF